MQPCPACAVSLSVHPVPDKGSLSTGEGCVPLSGGLQGLEQRNRQVPRTLVILVSLLVILQLSEFLSVQQHLPLLHLLVFILLTFNSSSLIKLMNMLRGEYLQKEKKKRL